MKYFYFPMETMRITQNYNGTASHKPHTTGTPKDYPIDCAGADSKQSAVFAPVDMKVTAVKGIGSSATNTIWLVSTEPVITPTFTDYVFMTLTHWNDNDSAIKKHKTVGSIVKANEIICYEGRDGATANHIHMVVGRGSSNNWRESSTGKWVITGDTKKPEEVMFLNPDFTKVADAGGLSFQQIPKYVGTPVARNENVNQIEVLVINLRARNKGTTSGTVLGYANKGIYNYIATNEANGYVWYEIEDGKWIASQNGWTNIYPKKEVVVEQPVVTEEPETNNTEDKNKIEELNNKITDYENQIKELQNEINTLQQELNNNKFSFKCEKTDLYAINLDEGDTLIIK